MLQEFLGFLRDQEWLFGGLGMQVTQRRGEGHCSDENHVGRGAGRRRG